MRRVFKTEYFRANHLVGQAKGELGGYRLLGVLGQGAGSTVYEVQDPADGQLYAMKVVVKNQPTDQRFIDQAMNEHEVGNRFDHPNLRKSLRVIRQGGLIVGGATQVLLLLELVDGVTLDDRRPRSRRLMVEVFKSVASGLDTMHQQGVVHADMKPINILLTNSGGLKIIDFGQSCPVNTVKMRIQGTLDYIAPEQVKRGPITARTDVYNLGATMYWCVTDHHPPTALRLRGTPGQPLPEVDAELRDPREYNPHLPPALANLILDCLNHDPADRPASMTDVRFRLDMALHQLRHEATPGAGAGAGAGGKASMLEDAATTAAEAGDAAGADTDAEAPGTSSEILAQIIADEARARAHQASRTEDLPAAEIIDEEPGEEGAAAGSADRSPVAPNPLALAKPVEVPIIDVPPNVDLGQELDLPLPVIASSAKQTTG